MEHLLAWGDKTSMAYSIEVRYPFLDFNFVERAVPLCGKQLFKNGFSKSLLRSAMKGIIPDTIRLEKMKVGFETPEDEWFRTDQFQNFISQILNSERFTNRGYINNRKAKNLYQKHLDKKINISGDIWKWINLELWFREFIDKKEINNVV
jgi:asparagine synthase (glutamine-hydrolysing)